MNRRISLAFLVAVLGLGAAACDQRPASGPGSPSAAPAKNTAGYDPSNTGNNQRDRDKNAITPGDQGENQADIRVTADIRKAILDDSSMSMDAKNIKVITVNGVTTLRGVVDSDAEKSAIESKSRAVAGVSQVDNQLEVKQNK
jgi:osmotically-inducible protein OsmY